MFVLLTISDFIFENYLFVSLVSFSSLEFMFFEEACHIILIADIHYSMFNT